MFGTASCTLPSAGLSMVSTLLLGVFIVGLGAAFARFAPRGHRTPVALVVVLVAGVALAIPRSASASTDGCPTTTTMASSSTPSTAPAASTTAPSTTVAVTTTVAQPTTTTTTLFPTTVACDKMNPANIAYAVDTGTGDGTYTGYTNFDAGTQVFTKFDSASSWTGGFTPTVVTHQWQTFASGTWSKASWDTGTNPLVVTGDAPLLNTISAGLNAQTARLFIRATDGSTVQDCAVLFVDLGG